ncbi:MAG: DUF3073 domain-containing protein [Actinomycetota bacterium]|nr:DUF3073 domain-containing protein [Actinomycetota bacterium]
MGRGRQKAKHTKVARDLKYFSPNTNYGALQQELTGTDPRLAEDLEKWPEYVAGSDPTADADPYDDEFDSDEDEKSA